MDKDSRRISDVTCKASNVVFDEKTRAVYIAGYDEFEEDDEKKLSMILFLESESTEAADFFYLLWRSVQSSIKEHDNICVRIRR